MHAILCNITYNEIFVSAELLNNLIKLCKNIYIIVRGLEDRISLIETTKTAVHLNINPIKDLLKKMPLDSVEDLQSFDSTLVQIPNGPDVFV